ncbi:uncharacterized protein LOC132751641 isoform X2 [Ruditapes philippinarum]|uniref:uncharacterized protein LOC132751641 isoform X2 n=1 Tax=Ruditapes philippinarum TaxID=129788 RepID=UPI00295A8E29|nr:uncharacterized protein LOC132751641 isoform X2 [Ruditapes philippinarum]
MSSDEHHRHEGGPLERIHKRDMVQRNAMENAAYNKVAKHLESEKRAFVRQNTRDEGEMKNLLYRLQQQTTYNQTPVTDQGDTSSEIDEVDWTGTPPTGNLLQQECVANPYPVTIIPKFGGNSLTKHPVISAQESSRSNSRRKSKEYEDVQESLSNMTVSNLSSASSNYEQTISSSSASVLNDDEASRAWLATPGAISSVRRMRKSVTEQTHSKILRKVSCDSSEFSQKILGSSPSHSRSNSLKEKKKSSCWEPLSANKEYRNRRGGSLKERKAGTSDRTQQCAVQRLSRSYSVLSKESVTSLNKYPDDCYITCRDGEKGTNSNRKSSKKNEKPRLTRKASNDSTASCDAGSPSSKKKGVRRKVGLSISQESSPNISPLATERETFKF